MFIEKAKGGYDRHGQQWAAGRFLMLVSPKEGPFKKEAIRALVRYVFLHQFGHYMMGTARVFGQSLTVSGAYGSDGLTMDVSTEIYEKATPVPPELIEAWATGGGHNSVGSEANAMQEWAKKTFPRKR